MADTTNTDTTAASGAASEAEIERAAFDAWAMEHGYQSDELARSTLSLVGFQYFNTNVESAFQAWRAGRASALAAPAAQEAEPAGPTRLLADPERREAARQDGKLASVWRNRVAGLIEDFAPDATAQYLADRIVSELYDLPPVGVPRPQADAGALDAPEGCTPADARMLRKANHALAAESFELQTALRGIVAQAGGALARFDIAAAPQAPAALTAAACAYAPLPKPYSAAAALGLDDLYTGDDMRAYADAHRATPAPAAGAVPIGTITQPYTVAEIRERVASGDYSAELLLQHALLHLGAGAAPTDAGGVDWLGLALDLEKSSGKVESQTAQRAMLAAAHGLRLIGAAAPAQEAEDAARYRWLRDETEWEPFDSAWLCKMDIYGCQSRAMDAAIDAARARQEGGA